MQAPLQQWRDWTGLPFDNDRPIAVRGGLAPVLVSVDRALGIYPEPNVWVHHTCRFDAVDHCRSTTRRHALPDSPALPIIAELVRP